MIPFIDLKRQHEPIREQIEAAIGSVLDSCQFASGDSVAEFEREFASYCDTRHAVAVNSGTSALHLALLSAGIGEGDEVITSPSTFVATAAAVRYAGARPVFVDIEPHTCTLDVGRIESAITPRTKAIIPVHLYGQCADMDEINEIADRHGLVVIEDACQAHGAEYKLRRAGSLGTLGCFSFYPGKNLGACGEGGIVVTNCGEHATRLRQMRDWGQREKNVHALPGFNYRMDGIQGAILRVKLSYLPQWNEARAACARRYDDILADSGLQLPSTAPWNRHVWHLYSVRTRDRDLVRESLQHLGIQTGLHYPTPVHLQEVHRDLGFHEGDFPHAEALALEQLSLPMFPGLDSSEQDEVAEAVFEALNPERILC